MKETIYGYARVSARDQCEDRQLIALEKFPIPYGRIYLDKLSGKDFNRPAYSKLMRRLKKGDVMVILSIDRLGRNYREIQEQWRIITKEKEAHIVVLDMPLLDTRQASDDLTGTFIADLVLQILCYVAQTERDNIHKRQAEGISAARVRGVAFGRPRNPIPDDFWPLKTQWETKKITSREAARYLDISQDTFLRWVRENSYEKFCQKK